MKQFLYLDKDIVGSIVAQAEKGLITEISNETEELPDGNIYIEELYEVIP